MFAKLLAKLLGSNETTKDTIHGTPEAAGAAKTEPTVIQSTDPTLTQIQLFALDFAPEGWLLCDGRPLPITQHMALFALLGTKYGGDGRQHFCLPDLRGKEPIPNTTYCICVAGVFPSRPS